MIIAEVIFIILIVCFGGVLLRGAPYLPTLASQIEAAIDLGKLKPGQTLLELGCGDGKVLLAAAERGINAVGYELNPFLVAVAWLRTRRHRRYVKVIWGDFWRANWPPADAIFIFLLSRYMDKLDKKIIRYDYKPIKLLSFAFEMPNRKPAATKGGIFMYEYK